MYLLMIPTGMSLHNSTCSYHPAACNEGLIAFANIFGMPALLLIFVVSIVVSVVLLKRQKRAFFVPLLGAVAMIGCVVIWGVLVDMGIGAI